MCFKFGMHVAVNLLNFNDSASLTTAKLQSKYSSRHSKGILFTLGQTINSLIQYVDVLYI